MTPRQKEVHALRKQGHSQRKIAEILGLSKSTIHDHLHKIKRYNELDLGIKNAMSTVGMTDVSALHSGWLKTDEASLYFINPQTSTKESLDSIVDYIAEVMNTITPVGLTIPQKFFDEDLITIYPIADAHMGMKAHIAEAGENYDLDTAALRVKCGISKCIKGSPSSNKAIILDVGDITHSDDGNYVTPRSKHPLDMSSSHYEAIDCAILTLCSCIELAADHHKEVLVRILRGNHNEHSYIAIMFALFERYRDNPNIIIEKTPSDFFVYTFGSNMFAAHHGDKAKAERLVMHMAHQWSEEWGRTKWRYYFTGHLHHAKLQDIGGVQVEQLRAVSSRDSYASSHGYVGAPQMQAITYHRRDGESSRVKVSF